MDANRSVGMKKTTWFTRSDNAYCIGLCGRCSRRYGLKKSTICLGWIVLCEGCGGKSNYVILPTNWMPIGVWEDD